MKLSEWLKYMKLRLIFISLFLLLTVGAVNAEEPDYLSMLAEESEIKAIAVVANVRTMSRNADGTFLRVTFNRKYALSSFTPKSFVGACKRMDNGWQKRAPGTVYFRPRKGQVVYVTITTNGGAITSYTPIDSHLESVIKNEPHRLAYSKGKARVINEDEY